MADIRGYIESHRDDVEAEYLQVLKQAEEMRRYWEERNRERYEKLAKTPLSPERQAQRAKLEKLHEERRGRKVETPVDDPLLIAIDAFLRSR